jgi:hypothetical protein
LQELGTFFCHGGEDGSSWSKEEEVTGNEGNKIN